MNKTDRWKNRRRMAWMALVAGLLFPLLVLFTDSTELGALATAFYIFVSAVVGSYMGFATMDDKYQRDSVDSYDRYNQYDQGPANTADYRDSLNKG